MNKFKNAHNVIEHLLILFGNGSSPEIPTKELSAAEQSYRETAKELRQFLDEIPGGFLIYRANAEEEIVFANAALLKIFKCDSLAQFKDLTGNSFKGMIHPDDLEAVEQSIKEQIAADDLHFDYVEYRIIRRDGIIRWIEDYGHYLNSGGDSGIFYVFISDATEKVTRHMLEKTSLMNENRKNEQKLKNLIQEYDKERKLINQEHLQRLEVIEGLSVNYDSILYANIDTDTVLPYRLSTRLVRQFDHKLQVRELRWFLNDYVKVWVHPDDRASVAKKTSIAYIKKALAAENTYYINYRCIQNGETQYIQLRIVNVSGSENVSQIVMGYRNIDKEVLQDLKQKQLLEDALKNAKLADIAKNTFLSNMSHDMRTPLNAIFGYVALAKKSAKECDRISGYLEKIETAGNHILDLIDKVLEISYTESQDVSLSTEPCDICEVIQYTVDMVMPLAKSKKINMSFRDNGVSHRYVHADVAKIKQIFNHIIGNAVKYTDVDGSVEVDITEKDGKFDEFATFTVSVKDTGIGMKKSFMAKLFDPFEREYNTTTSGVYGTGLGLTIAKHLIELMGGSIDVKSAVGKGSTFTVTLGFKIDSSAGVRKNEDESECVHIDLTGRKILIVEDNEINLEIETDLLRDLGFVTDSASNGLEAVEKVSASADGEYSLVLMDIQMPVMDGRRAAEEIRKLPNPAHNDIPIIALSANAFESDKRESIKSGMDAHLNKPIDIDALMDTIKQALQKRIV